MKLTQWILESERKMSIIIITIAWITAIICHWFISGFLFSTANDNLEWTRMEIFSFLAMFCSLLMMVLMALAIVKKPENLEEG